MPDRRPWPSRRNRLVQLDPGDQSTPRAHSGLGDHDGPRRQPRGHHAGRYGERETPGYWTASSGIAMVSSGRVACAPWRNQEKRGNVLD